MVYNIVRSTLMTEGLYGNCPFSIMYLLLRGRIKQVEIVRSRAWIWPYHYIGQTHKNHRVHFQAIFPHEQNKFAPWWFYAKVVGVSDRRNSPVLKREKLMVLNWSQSVLLFSTILITLIIPWTIAWMLYPAYWLSYWGIDAIKKRKK